jgi:hypothetical protein
LHISSLACTQVESQRPQVSIFIYRLGLCALFELESYSHRFTILVGLERKRAELLGYLNSSLSVLVLGLNSNEVRSCGIVVTSAPLVFESNSMFPSLVDSYCRIYSFKKQLVIRGIIFLRPVC